MWDNLTPVRLRRLLEELGPTFVKETNFLAEAKNLNDFYEFHKSVHGVTCPKSYLDLCTEHVGVMELDDGIFHADPHAGNIILKDGIVYFIDLGMVGRMSSHDRGIVKDMIFALSLFLAWRVFSGRVFLFVVFVFL